MKFSLRKLVAVSFLLMLPEAAKSRAEVDGTPADLRRDLELFLLTPAPLFKAFEEDQKGWANWLPDDLRMLIFLEWIDYKFGELVNEGHRDFVTEINRAAAELHRGHPRDFFHLLILASTEERLGNPQGALKLLAPVPERLCDPEAATLAYDFPSPLGGKIKKGVYLNTILGVHLRASGQVQGERGFAARLRDRWRLIQAYARATVFVSPVQEVVQLRELMGLVLRERPATGGISLKALEALEEEHPVWSFILPDPLFRMYALAWLKERCVEIGQNSGAAARRAADLAEWLSAVQRRHPGDPWGAVLLAGLESGYGRQEAGLATLSAVWSHRGSSLERPFFLGSSDRPVLLPELVPMASLHAVLSWRQAGWRAYVRTVGFYGLRCVEALPVPMSGLLTVYMALGILCICGVILRGSSAGIALSDRFFTCSFARLNRRRESRLLVQPSQVFPRVEDFWRKNDGEVGSGNCELASLVAALTLADVAQRKELIGALTTLRTPDGEPLNPKTALTRFVARSPSSPNYWAGLLRDLAFCQFEEGERPIVELVSNAVDATRALRDGTQEWFVKASLFGCGKSILQKGTKTREADSAEDEKALRLVLVQDWGCGMSPETALFDLLVPLTTTKQGSEETIGRFGVGFFSVLRYLNHPRAHVLVSTSDGRHTTEIFLTPPSQGSESGGPEVALRIKEGSLWRGTQVEVRGVIDLEGCEALLARTFRFLPWPAVYLSSSVNDLKGFRRIEAEGGVELMWREIPEGEPSRLSVVVRGEVIAGPFELRQPGFLGFELGLLLPPSAWVAVSRNLPVVDQALVNSLERAMAVAADLGERSWGFLNLLAELADRLRIHHREPSRQGDLDEALRLALLSLQHRACSGETLFLPLGEGVERIDLEAFQKDNSGAPVQVVFLHPRLFQHVGAASLEPYRALPGAAIFALPMRASEVPKQHEDETERASREEEEVKEEMPITFQVEGLTFLDRRFRPVTAVGRAACRILASTALAQVNVGGGSAP